MKKYIHIILIVIGVVLLGYGIKSYDDKMKSISIELEEQWKSIREEKKKVEEEYVISVGDEKAKQQVLLSAYDVIMNNCKADILIDSQYFNNNVFCNNIYLKTRKASAELDNLDFSVNEDDIIILQFKAYSLGENVSLSVNCANIINSVYITKETQYFYIPVTGITTIDRIFFEITSDYSKIKIDEVYLVNFHNDFEISELATGIYSDDEQNEIILSQESQIISEPSLQCLENDGLIYTVSKQELFVYKKTDNGYKEISSLKGMPNIRDMKFSNDRQAILIAARQSGVFIVDISNPYDIKLLSHYDTLEAVSGLAVIDNYVFLCSRYFGVEFVDISNLSNPKYINKVTTSSEYQNCFVCDNYLFVAVYAQKRVDVYDIQDLNNPVLMSKISLDGECSGVYAQENILYVATALDSANEHDSLKKFGRGTGNGMEIYDLTNKEQPVLLSRVKVEGRFWINTNDVWDIKVSDNYAYLTNMYNGVYVFDVTNPKQPNCIDSIYLKIPLTDDEYKYFDRNKYLTTWDQNEEGRGCIYHVEIGDGILYVVSPDMGVYEVEYNNAKKNNRLSLSDITIGNKTNQGISFENHEYKIYNDVNCLWAVTTNEDFIYVAAGESGILKLDMDLNIIDAYKTNSSVRDLKIIDGYLITAESIGGVALYDIKDGFKEISRIKNVEATQIELTPDGNYALVQMFQSAYMVLDISNKFDMKVEKKEYVKTGAMYYRNICNGSIDNKYVVAYGSKNICTYYTENGHLIEMDSFKNDFYSEAGGMCSSGRYGIVIYDGGYVYINMEGMKVSELKKVDGLYLRGKCSSNGKVLVVSDSVNSKLHVVDIEDIENPVVVTSIEIDGNPDIAYIEDDFILIPCRYGGLIKLFY